MRAPLVVGGVEVDQAVAHKVGKGGFGEEAVAAGAVLGDDAVEVGDGVGDMVDGGGVAGGGQGAGVVGADEFDFDVAGLEERLLRRGWGRGRGR